MKRSKRVIAVAAAAMLAAAPALSQAFGFGEAEGGDEGTAAESGGGTGGGGSVRVGGRVEYGATGFLREFEHPAGAAVSNALDGRVELTATAGAAEAVLKLRVVSDGSLAAPTPEIDEASVRVFFGPLELQGGLLKASWGKADTEGPLDALNPFDRRDLTVTDTVERKIARPMLRAALPVGLHSRLELALLPNFIPEPFAWEGPWRPAAIGEYIQLLGGGDAAAAASQIAFPDTSTLEYAQGGLRFTSTVGGVDLGAQYFYGFLPSMAVSPADVGTYLYVRDVLHLTPGPIPVAYDRCHQAGLDAAAELLGLNWRAEAALNLTEDLSGDDPEVYNPALAWSLGFDRELFSGVELNLMGHGSVRLFHGRVDDNGTADLEAGADATKTKLTAVLSQALFKDALDWKLTCRWGVEDGDFLLLPTVGFVVADARLELTAGIFGGNSDGELGQFAESSWARLRLSYRF